MVSSSYFKKKVFVGQRGTEHISYGVDDMSDIYAYLDSAQGYPTMIRSPTYYWDNALRIQRPNDNLFGYSLRTTLVDHDVEVYLPPVPTGINTDFLLFAETPQEVKNKTITPGTNTLTGIEKLPDFAKTGKYQGSGYEGEGMMEALIHKHTPELKGDSTHGSFAQYLTPTAAEKETGYWVANDFMTMTKFDPVVKTKIRIPDWSVSTNRFYFGLVSSNFILNNDIPYGSNDAAALLGFRKTDSDVKLLRNVGNGITVTQPYSSNVDLNTTVLTLEFGFTKEGTEMYYLINDQARITFTSNLPQNNRWMKLHCSLQNTNSGTPRHLDLFYSRIESKR